MALTVNPFPDTCCETGLLLCTDPHQLGAQFAFSSIQFGQDVIVCRTTEIVNQIATCGYCKNMIHLIEMRLLCAAALLNIKHKKKPADVNDLHMLCCVCVCGFSTSIKLFKLATRCHARLPLSLYWPSQRWQFEYFICANQVANKKSIYVWCLCVCIWYLMWPMTIHGAQ